VRLAAVQQDTHSASWAATNSLRLPTKDSASALSLHRASQASHSHWGQGVLETSDYILSTLWALVYRTQNVSADNILNTFEMFPAVPGWTHIMGTFWSHLECNFNMFSACDHW
jgi:hypothetical protein